MKTFSEFQEGVASLAVKGGSKLIPALVTGIGAAGTIMQSKKKDDINITPRNLKNLENAVFRDKKGRKLDGEILKRREQKRRMKGPFADTPSAEELRKAKLTGKITIKPKKGEKKEALKTLKDFLKARKIEGRTAMRLKQDDELATKGPGDQLPGARRDYLKNLLKNLRKEEVMTAPTNNVGGGQIAGTVEAGDDPPVKKKNKRGSGVKSRKKKKKKTYAYGGRGSRKMWMA